MLGCGLGTALLLEARDKVSDADAKARASSTSSGGRLWGLGLGIDLLPIVVRCRCFEPGCLSRPGA